MQYRLKTIGHATQLLFEGDTPLIATDPWLIGSAYWRSWWLEKYPTEEEFKQVANAKYVYLTHSHPDHFHYPTLRKLGTRLTLNPRFPRYDLTGFLESEGIEAKVMEPWNWYQIGENVRAASIPVPIDDSILLIDTPNAYVANLNDSVPRISLLRFIRSQMLTEDKPVVMLKSYSPASIASAIYRDGERSQMKTKADYTHTAVRLAEALGATHYVPFASQAFFNRRDSVWANDFKVTYEDLDEYWNTDQVKLCPPFVDIDLETLEVKSDYSSINRNLDAEKQRKVAEREQEEGDFVIPEDFPKKLHRYMDEIYFLRLFFRRGIGWRLTTSGKEFFYDTKRKKIVDKIPEDYDVIISLPDKVLDESLTNNVLTDLGITMFIKVETKVSNRFTYGLFLLMGIHDYGHFNSYRDFVRFSKFYFPYFVPSMFRAKWLFSKAPSRLPSKAI
jgi:hypothetical protein